MIVEVNYFNNSDLMEFEIILYFHVEKLKIYDIIVLPQVEIILKR